MHEVTLDQAQQQFSVQLEENKFAIAKFRYENGVYIITSTQVPAALQGRGFGQVLMEAVLNEIDKRDAKIGSECSFVTRYLERNEQWHYLQV